VQIQVTGMDRMLSNINDLNATQLPFALAKALTATAKAIQAAEKNAVSQVFDRPTPFTKNAFGITPATKANLVATVFAKDAQAKYLEPEVIGGTRPLKTFEQRFADGGSAKVALPGQAVKLNQYGNMSKAQILRIARDLNTSGSNKRFFRGVPKGGNLPAGIYARVNKNERIEPLIVFATNASYKKRFDFSAIAQATYSESFERNLRDAWGQALATMKK
jgi:hypothetical protein